MSDVEHRLEKNTHRSHTNQTEQRLLTWSDHVISWVDNPVFNTHVIRFEDMKHNPKKTFSEAVEYLKIPSNSDQITKALSFSDFKLVQQQENKNKFHERPPNISQFFRKGIAGDWQKTLTTQQIDKIISNHYEVMLRFGYLDNAGNPKVM